MALSTHLLPPCPALPCPIPLSPTLASSALIFSALSLLSSPLFCLSYSFPSSLTLPSLTTALWNTAQRAVLLPCPALTNSVYPRFCLTYIPCHALPCPTPIPCFIHPYPALLLATLSKPHILPCMVLSCLHLVLACLVLPRPVLVSLATTPTFLRGYFFYVLLGSVFARLLGRLRRPCQTYLTPFLSALSGLVLYWVTYCRLEDGHPALTYIFFSSPPATPNSFFLPSGVSFPVLSCMSCTFPVWCGPLVVSFPSTLPWLKVMSHEVEIQT